MSLYRNSSGTRYLKALFFEPAIDKTFVLYTLKEADHEVIQEDGTPIVYPSLQRLYLECNDPTEFLVATQYFDGVEHWDMLCNCSWFQPHLSRMRRQLELKIKSEQIQLLMEDSKAGTKSSTASAKFLLTQGYASIAPDKRKAGRPSKEEIADAAARSISDTRTLEDDFQRVISLRNS